MRAAVQHGCLRPHIIVESSPGRAHCYWLVKNVGLDEFEGIQCGLAQKFDGDSAVRILTTCARLPGFFHNKKEPFRTRIESYNVADAYDLDEVLIHFPPLAKPHKQSHSHTGIILPVGAPVKWAEEFLRHKHSLGTLPLLRHYRGAFYQYTGTHYHELPDEVVESQVYDFLDQALTSDSKKGYLPLNPTRSKVAEVVHALRRGTATLIHREREAPCWLDKPETPAGNLVSCRNDILNVDTRELIPHDPTFFTMNSIPIDFNPNAPKPKRWLKFLEEVWPEDEPAEYCLQEIFGYLLTPDTSQQKIFLLVGPKRGGKGTVVFILVELLGKENVVFPTLRSMAGDFGGWQLIDKTLAVIADARLGSKVDSHAIAERLLSISGGDPQTINRKHQAFWTGYLHVRFVITSNEVPTIADVSGTLASRYVFLKLTESFYNREDKGLKNKLRPELPGILNWTLDGRDALRERGYFEMPASSLDSIRQIEDLSSPIKAFLRERCNVGTDHTENVKTVYNAFKAWADDASYRPMQRHVFGRALHALLPGLDESGHGERRTYLGVALVPRNVREDT